MGIASKCEDDTDSGRQTPGVTLPPMQYTCLLAESRSRGGLYRDGPVDDVLAITWIEAVQLAVEPAFEVTDEELPVAHAEEASVYALTAPEACVDCV